MSDQAWIEQSLARLEQLEAQKAELEAAGDTEALAEVESEIRALYVALESVAEDGDDGDDTEAPAAAAPASVFASDDEPLTDDGESESPFGASEGDDVPSVDDAPLPFATGVSAPASFDDDVKTGGSRVPLFAGAAVVVLAAVVGGGYALSTGGTKAAAPAALTPVGDAKVISASSVPEDTQEPEVAQGAEVTRTEGTRFRERPAAPRRTSNTKPKKSSATSKRRASEEDDGRKLKSAKGDDPLSGI